MIYIYIPIKKFSLKFVRTNNEKCLFQNEFIKVLFRDNIIQ